MGVGELVSGIGDRLASSDPGLGRLRTAIKAVVGVGTTLGVEYLFAPLSGESTLIAMLLGAIVAMLASMGVADPTRAGKAVTFAFFPVAISPGLLLGAAVSPYHVVSLVVFVAVMFVAVWARRFGMRFFMYGMLIWMGYFLADLLGATLGQYPDLLFIVVVATVWTFILALTVFADRPERVLRRTLRAFALRAQAVAGACLGLLDAPDDRRAKRRLRRRLTGLDEAALMVDAQLGDTAALPQGWSPATLRRALVDLELGLGNVANATARLAHLSAGVPEDERRRAEAVLEGLSEGRPEDMATSIQAVIDEPGAPRVDPGGPDRPELPVASALVRYLSLSAVGIVRIIQGWAAGTDTDIAEPGDGEPSFEPALRLAAGNLPGSTATVQSMLDTDKAYCRHSLARLAIPTRQAIQVAVAAALAMVAGEALSTSRYYWAVIAAFVAFTGTTTSAETLLKAFNRVGGTLVGLGVAIVLAEATAGNTDAALGVILVSLFLGFYLNRLSYAAMIFFITVMIAQLYALLHEFTAGLLVLRLEETAVGAGIGVAVALFVLPISTQATARAARTAFFEALGDLVAHTGPRLAGTDQAGDLIGLSRSLDAKLQQLLLVTRPLTRNLLFGAASREVRRRTDLCIACAFYARGLAASAESVGASHGTELAPACEQVTLLCADLTSGKGGGRTVAGPEQRPAPVDWTVALAAETDHPGLPARYLLRLSEALQRLTGRAEISTGPDPLEPTGRANGSSRPTEGAAIRSESP